ncbi:MAG TPA: ABC transporter ATP-binding protein [Firmicutes bacterium]|jgi:NitT/TauT family transport system ATP-binding protein|nr:ABC transporter ATP-binding protein [Bacillota bacterium]
MKDGIGENSGIKVDTITKNYGPLRVLAGISMTIPSQKIVAILGPSACGKTTFLSILAGLEQPDAGTVTGLSTQGVGFLFQEPRLLDWLTVYDNLTFVLTDKLPQANLRPAIEEYLKSMDLYAYRNYYPQKLSGGQRQRVAIARALLYPSPVLLMDEPFKSLDLGLKFQLIRDFLELWSKQPRTVICVTHDVKEALLLADEIYFFSQKPTVIKEHFIIRKPRAERSLDDPDLLEMEQEMIKVLIEENNRSPRLL